jgi:phage tail sheath protein FI
MVVSGTGVVSAPTVASITDPTHFVLSSSQSIGSGVVLTFTPTNFNSTWVALAAAVNNGQNALRQPSIWVTAVAGGGTTIPSLPAVYQLVGGGDGVGTITATVLTGDSSVPSGMYALSNLNVAILDCCDVDDSTAWTTIDAFAIGNSSYAIQVIPSGTTVTNAVTAKRTAGLDSAYSKLLHGDWLYWDDPVTGVTRLVSPQAFVAGRLANLSPQNVTLNKPIFGIAGSQKTGISGINQTAYTTADLTSLFQSGIDVVTLPGAGGFNIWTCRSGHTSSTNLTLQLDNYPTLTNYIAKTLASGMGFYIGEVITPQLFFNVTATLSQFMQNLTGAGLLATTDGTTPYAVQCNVQNNPPSQTKIGIVTATVQAVYPSINSTFIVNLQGGSTVTVTVQNQG